MMRFPARRARRHAAAYADIDISPGDGAAATAVAQLPLLRPPRKMSS